MTLLEVLISLVILALVMGAALSIVGPGLAQARRLEGEARFWREAQAAQLSLGELTTGALDLDKTLSRSETQVRFRTYAPRLARAPIDVQLSVAGGDLALTSSAVTGGRPVRLLSTGRPLRLVVGGPAGAGRAVVVEAAAGRGWAPVIVAPFATNAAQACIFDIISQACR